jgi:steroid Delta-isomerase
VPTEDEMKAVLQGYLDGFEAGDAEAVLGLFADDAVVEDPYGNPPMVGKDAFREFFTNAVGAGAKLVLDTPIRGSHGNGAAMAFTIEVPGMTIKAIDAMTFGDDGKISSMRAFYGPGDIST